MANQRVRFSVSIKELTLTYEGDAERGESLQQGVNRTLEALASLQSEAMGIEGEVSDRKRIESRIIEPPAVNARRRRRRRASSVPTGDESADGHLTGGGGGTAVETAVRRKTGANPTERVMDLRRSGFFGEQRTSGDVLNELHRRGFSMLRPNDLTSPLRALVQRDVLRRDRDEQKNQWVYSNGAQDDAE